MGVEPGLAGFDRQADAVEPVVGRKCDALAAQRAVDAARQRLRGMVVERDRGHRRGDTDRRPASRARAARGQPKHRGDRRAGREEQINGDLIVHRDEHIEDAEEGQRMERRRCRAGTHQAAQHQEALRRGEQHERDPEQPVGDFHRADQHGDLAQRGDQEEAVAEGVGAQEVEVGERQRADHDGVEPVRERAVGQVIGDQRRRRHRRAHREPERHAGDRAIAGRRVEPRPDQDGDRPNAEQADRLAVGLAQQVAGQSGEHDQQQRPHQAATGVGVARVEPRLARPWLDQQPGDDADGDDDTGQLAEHDQRADQETNDGEPPAPFARQPGHRGDDQQVDEQRVPVGRRVEKLDERQRRPGQRADDADDRAARAEQQEDQPRLDDAHGDQRIAQRHEVVAEQPERRGVEEIVVARVDVVDVAVHHLAGQDALGHVEVGAVVGRPPEAVVVVAEHQRRERQRDDQADDQANIERPRRRRRLVHGVAGSRRCLRPKLTRPTPISVMVWNGRSSEPRKPGARRKTTLPGAWSISRLPDPARSAQR